MEVRKKGWQKLLLAIFVRMIHWMRNVLYLELSASKVFGDLENPCLLYTSRGDALPDGEALSHAVTAVLDKGVEIIRLAEEERRKYEDE